MTSLTSRNIRMALQSIKSTKLRSFLTMLGIIIGVASVITAVSLGEGIRRQVANSLKVSHENVITIRPGRLVNRDQSGQIISVNYQSALGTTTLTEQDLQALSQLPDVASVSPLSTISSLAKSREGRAYDSVVIGASPAFGELSGQKVAYGSFFSATQANRDVAVVGKRVAEELFQENVPIGQIVTLRGHDFIVSGVFDEFTANSLSNGTDLNRAIFIPHNAAKAISGNTASIYQILVGSKNDDTTKTARTISATLQEKHGGQQDFTVLTKDEMLQLAGETLTVATSFVAGIAAISLIVGGIGIMNIMFVGVTERTREIGVRKSLGATNRQIYSQFLIEATLISFVGGLIGVIVALTANFFLRISTSLTPVATLPIIGIAVVVAMTVGMVFGTAPAIKAARKDPIESLRYE
jgi:putative ABC transport system permease protein